MSATAYHPSLGAARAADLMRMRDAERLVAIKAEARLANSRERRLRAVGARLAPLLTMLEQGLREEKLDAVRRGERGRADAVERQIDGLYETFDELARNIVEDLR